MSLDFIGSIFQAKAQDRATAENAKNVADTNRMNLLLSIMARGQPLSVQEAASLGVPELAGKTSAILPNYLSDIEKATGTNAGQMALALQKAAPTIGDYTQALAPYLAQAGLAAGISGDLLSGGMTKQMLAEQQPVSEARMGVALTKKNAALEALDKTLNEIDAIQARKGYSGDSYGNRLLKANTRAAIMSGSAGDIALAKLANAQDVQGIQNKGRALQLSNLMLPGTLGVNELSLRRAPTTATASTFSDTMQPLSFFNIGNHAFNEQNLPIVDRTSQTGLALSGLTSNANAGINYGLKKYFDSINKDPYGGSNPENPGAGEFVSADFGSSALGAAGDAGFAEGGYF